MHLLMCVTGQELVEQWFMTGNVQNMTNDPVILVLSTPEELRNSTESWMLDENEDMLEPYTV